ncbi:E3 ubiquitin-protein ligase KCMF1-like [Drosophila guanche]|uniref:RING-type E3 ubiquitin transferase n=1 Tax=Drosophila guanche TaxID=7266 RepID=A0A3B0K2L4_DROGU|nr:E3 ubiquitin-protein ligase KCMF1-like [Drosophila guanche]SPP88507.1 blast:E3 ubiquitin-protein ligase KCMF1 [Drosophila guanche]
MEYHFFFECDGCGSDFLVKYRYKCLKCDTYNLCQTCYDNKVTTLHHHLGHAMQCLLDPEARRLHFSGEPMPVLCAESFTCPLCGIMGHTDIELMKHAREKHHDDWTLVTCPLCAATASGDPYPLRNISEHFRSHHGSTAGILRNNPRVNVERNAPPEADIDLAEAWPLNLTSALRPSNNYSPDPFPEIPAGLPFLDLSDEEYV